MMKHTIEGLKNRLHNLTEKDSIGNAKLIAKTKRKIRLLEKRG
jgi:hypothetical protein